jgi:hypothetical protein
MEDGSYRGEESLLLAEGEEGFRTGGKDGVQQCTFLEKQLPELCQNRKGDMEVGTIWKHVVHIRHPLVHMDLGAN